MASMKGVNAMSIIDQAKEDFNLLKTNPEQYSAKVSQLGKGLGLELRGDCLPTYYGGNISNPNLKYAFISLNPMFHKKTTNRFHYGKTYFEESLKKENLNKYLDFLQNCYRCFSEHKISYSYFSKLINLFYGLEKLPISDKWDWYHNNYINLDLIPYYSDKTPTIKVDDDETRKYLSERLESNINFICSQFPHLRLIGFNGKIYGHLLSQLAGLRKVEDIHYQGKKVNLKIHIFKLFRDKIGVPLVQFDAFITNCRGMYNEDLTKIGRMIGERIEL